MGYGISRVKTKKKQHENVRLEKRCSERRIGRNRFFQTAFIDADVDCKYGKPFRGDYSKKCETDSAKK